MGVYIGKKVKHQNPTIFFGNNLVVSLDLYIYFTLDYGRWLGKGKIMCSRKKKKWPKNLKKYQI